MKTRRVVRVDFALILIEAKRRGSDMAIVILKCFDVNVEEVACKFCL